MLTVMALAERMGKACVEWFGRGNDQPKRGMIARFESNRQKVLWSSLSPGSILCRVIDDNDRRTVIAWFAEHGRSFPWRATKDPYLVLIAAFMLQRTGVSQVMNVYPAFAERFPSLDSLSRADAGELYKLLRPLGRLTRVPQLLGMARTIEFQYGGVVPDNLKALEDLPGLGQYSARSVMCMAFGQPYIMLDPNSYRVVNRAWGFASTKSRVHTDRDLIAALDAEVPEENPRSFNLALLDIGSQVCRKRKPRHDECPLAGRCIYQEEDRSGRTVCI
jgi:A/G-specific adenine glycosylase